MSRCASWSRAASRCSPSPSAARWTATTWTPPRVRSRRPRRRSRWSPGSRRSTLREEYARRLAGWLGVDPGPIVGRVRQAGRRTVRGRTTRRGTRDGRRSGRTTAAVRATRDRPRARSRVGAGCRRSQHRAPGRPDPADRRSSVEREMVKLVLQQPDLVASGYAQVQAVAFTEPAYLAVHEAVLRAGGPEETGGGAAWVTAVAEQAPAGAVRSLVTELAVEPPATDPTNRTVDTPAPSWPGWPSGPRRSRNGACSRRCAGPRPSTTGTGRCPCRPIWSRWPRIAGRCPIGPAARWSEVAGVKLPWRRESLPPALAGRLEPDELITAMARADDGHTLLTTRRGLWVVDDERAERLGWERVAKARLELGVLTLVPLDDVTAAGRVRTTARAGGGPRRPALGVPAGQAREGDRSGTHPGSSFGGGQPLPALAGRRRVGRAAPGPRPGRAAGATADWTRRPTRCARAFWRRCAQVAAELRASPDHGHHRRRLTTDPPEWCRDDATSIHYGVTL